MKKMNKLVYDALQSRYRSEIDCQVTNLVNLLFNPVGIGEHADIVSEADKMVEKIAHAYDKLKIVNSNLEVSDPLHENKKILWENDND